MTNTVTVRYSGKPSNKGRYTVTFSQLPGKSFGPWDFVNTVRDLGFSAMLTPLDARNLVLDTHQHGRATAPMNRSV
jgi:hypothetical protein